MLFETWIVLAFIAILQVCAIPKNEDEALRKVFEYLKRKYSEDTSDGEDTDTLPTLEPLTPPPTVQQDMRGGAHDIYTLPTLEPLTPPLTAREPQEVKSHDMKQISLPGKTELNGKSVKNEFHKPHTLPGCDFLLNILHEAPSLPIKNDIIDYFDQYASVYSEGLVKDLKPVLEYSEDFDAIALLATRKVTRMIFLERMRCPATKFDMFTVKQMLKELTDLVQDEDDSMYDFLATTMYDLHEMSYRGYDPNFLAHEMTKHVHAQLFNDTIDYLLGTSLLDVEDFARYFYKTLQQRLPALATLSDHLMKSELKKLVTDNIIYANVHCPTAVDVSRRHLDAVWDMTIGLKEIETFGLCMQIRDYLEQFVTLPSHMTDHQVQNYNDVMNGICDYVREYVQKILTREKEYQKMVAARDALALQEFFQHYLTEDELTVLAEVLEKLHWIPNFPVTDKPFLPENLTGEFLPKTHVISNELQDIDYWKSYLETMSLERFQEMDLTDFKESIRRWLKEKEARLDTYYSMESKTSHDNDTSTTGDDNSGSLNEEPLVTN